jgi:hypothetical protein
MHAGMFSHKKETTLRLLHMRARDWGRLSSTAKPWTLDDQWTESKNTAAAALCLAMGVPAAVVDASVARHMSGKSFADVFKQ